MTAIAVTIQRKIKCRTRAPYSQSRDERNRLTENPLAKRRLGGERSPLKFFETREQEIQIPDIQWGRLACDGNKRLPHRGEYAAKETAQSRSKDSTQTRSEEDEHEEIRVRETSPLDFGGGSVRCRYSHSRLLHCRTTRASVVAGRSIQRLVGSPAPADGRGRGGSVVKLPRQNRAEITPEPRYPARTSSLFPEDD